MNDGTYRSELDITNYENKYREMDPKTEDLIADGCDLKNGMRVLIADPRLRVDVSRGFGDPKAYGINGLNEEMLYRAKETNRWCTISHLSYDGDRASFVGTYDDGIKRKRTYNCNLAWFVKLDSMKQDETCSHPIDTHAPHCTTPDCFNYVGRFSRS